jgi:hypothetical protein
MIDVMKIAARTRIVIILLLFNITTLSFMTTIQYGESSDDMIKSVLAQISNSSKQGMKSDSPSSPSIRTALEQLMAGIAALSTRDPQNALVHLRSAHEQLSMLSGTIPSLTSPIQNASVNNTLLLLPSSNSTGDGNNSILEGASQIKSLSGTGK